MYTLPTIVNYVNIIISQYFITEDNLISNLVISEPVW